MLPSMCMDLLGYEVKTTGGTSCLRCPKFPQLLQFKTQVCCAGCQEYAVCHSKCWIPLEQILMYLNSLAVNCKGISFWYCSSYDGSFEISWTWPVSAALASSLLRSMELMPRASTDLELGANWDLLWWGRGFCSVAVQGGQVAPNQGVYLMPLKITSSKGQKSCVRSASSHGWKWLPWK